jgi:hypothetical protein
VKKKALNVKFNGNKNNNNPTFIENKLKSLHLQKVFIIILLI